VSYGGKILLRLPVLARCVFVGPVLKALRAARVVVLREDDEDRGGQVHYQDPAHRRSQPREGIGIG
jgi:hypothetical protein